MSINQFYLQGGPSPKAIKRIFLNGVRSTSSFHKILQATNGEISFEILWNWQQKLINKQRKERSKTPQGKALDRIDAIELKIHDLECEKKELYESLEDLEEINRHK
jgi:hypothetical protein